MTFEDQTDAKTASIRLDEMKRDLADILALLDDLQRSAQELYDFMLASQDGTLSQADVAHYVNRVGGAKNVLQQVLNSFTLGGP